MSFIFGTHRQRRRSSDTTRHVGHLGSTRINSPRRSKADFSPLRSRPLTIMPDDTLFSLRGVRFKETIVSSITRGEPRWFSPSSSPDPGFCGPLVTFSFLLPTKCEKLSYKDQQAQLKSVFEESPLFQDGLLLDTREKGVMFPVVHMSNKGELGKSNQDDLPNEVLLHRGVYQEVRNIVPETELPRVAPEHQEQRNIGYILLGFKSLDKNFSQVMVDTWKDWTGARYIYMYLPDDLGLRRITFYHRQMPDDLDLFMYLVIVECHGITSRDKQIRLLDFAQRMRLERMTGYISVYNGQRQCDKSNIQPELKQNDVLDSFLTNTIAPRNTRV